MFVALKKVLGYHKFRDGWEVGTFMTQWLIMQVMNCCLQGIKGSLHSIINPYLWQGPCGKLLEWKYR
jgi:hypothetical protein